MSFIIAIFQKIGNVFRAFVRILRKAFCCRRRHHEVEPLLPVTSESCPDSSRSKSEQSEFIKWDDWNDTSTSSTKLNSVVVDMEERDAQPEVPNSKTDDPDGYEDYFKDMVPQFRRAKKISSGKGEDSCMASSSRLSMDPKAFLAQEIELGFLMDTMLTTWEAGASLDDIVDTDGAIREKRLEEKLKRIEEHQRKKKEKMEEYQRRKQEKDNRKCSLKSTISANMQSFHPSKDKSKNS